MSRCKLFNRALVIDNRKFKYYYKTKLNILDEINLKDYVYNSKYLCVGDDTRYSEIINKIINVQKNDEFLSLQNENIFYITDRERVDECYSKYKIINRNRKNNDEILKMLNETEEYKFIIFDGSLSYYELNGRIGDYLLNNKNIGYFIYTSRPYFCTKKIINDFSCNLILLDHEKKNFYRDLYFISLNDSCRELNNIDNIIKIKREIFDIVMNRFSIKNYSCLFFGNGKFYSHYF
jgi:hypothetical protein